MRTLLKNLLVASVLVSIHIEPALAVQKVNSCITWYETTGNVQLRQSVIITPDGKKIISAAENPTLDLPKNLPEDVKGFMEFLNSRTPEVLMKIKNELTRVFAEFKAGSFAVKDDKGKSKPFYVTVNPIPVPIPRSYEQGLIESARALFEAKNDLLQTFYSKENVTVEDLRKIAVKGTPDAVLEDVISYVKSNPYFEKGAVSRSMENYRFISVVGVDHALTTLKELKALGFEFNGGTPSGWSNTRSIVETYKKVLPQYSYLFERLLNADKAFENLKTTMDSHGAHWTGNKAGVSVVISPGHFNAAHPDVVTIAENSGMTLVKMSDLYVDRSGSLRLNQPGVDPKDHPAVTSIYSRQEESALFSATSPSKGLSFKTPRKLSDVEKSNLNSIGVKVEEGIGYDFIENSKGEIIDVKRDKAGQPKKSVMENAMLGRDPTLGVNEPTSTLDLLDLNNNRKVYLSNRGGRTLDIKPLFDIITTYFAPKHTSGTIFSPPKTLKLNDPRMADSQHDLFYANPKGFVVKVADESSGNGVDIVSQKSPEEIQKIVEKVRADQMRVKKLRASGSKDAVAAYTIQEFVNSAVITTVIIRDGKPVKVTVVPDLRKFINMLPNGEVLSGDMGYLGRNGVYGSAISNTGKGGEYFFPIIYEDGPLVAPKKMNAVATGKVISPKKVTASDLLALNSFLGSLGELRHMQRLFGSNDAEYSSFLQNAKGFSGDALERINYEYRNVMHLLGPEFRPLQSLFDRRRAGQLSDIQFRNELSSIVNKMSTQSEPDWTYSEVRSAVKYWLVDWTTYDYRGHPEQIAQ